MPIPPYPYNSALGALIALLVVLAALVFALTGQMDVKIAALLIALGISRLT